MVINHLLTGMILQVGAYLRQQRHVGCSNEDGNTILKLEGAGCFEDFFHGQVVTVFYMGRKVYLPITLR